MAEEASKDDPKHPPPFLEVKCTGSGKIKRFAVGTKAGFAVSLINRKFKFGTPLALYVEAVKEGEEPISFGPDAALTDYGTDWKLQTVSEADHSDFRKHEGFQPIKTQIPNVTSFDGPHHLKRIPKSGISFMYIAKILVAFFLMFVLGGIFVLALESLPRLILFINSFM